MRKVLAIAILSIAALACLSLVLWLLYTSLMAILFCIGFLAVAFGIPVTVCWAYDELEYGDND